jgi:hypothetical protein
MSRQTQAQQPPNFQNIEHSLHSLAEETRSFGNWINVLQQDRQLIVDGILAALTDPDTGPLTALQIQLNAITNPNTGSLATMQGNITTMQRDITTMQRDIAILLRNQAIVDNRTKGEGVSFPYSIVTDVNGNNPPIAIQNLHDLTNLDGQGLRQLCIFYGINPIPQQNNGRRRAIARVCGFNVVI